jgi:hypothetical protein
LIRKISVIPAFIAHDFDIMLEIKDKEKSALSAFILAQNDPRLYNGDLKTDHAHD